MIGTECRRSYEYGGVSFQDWVEQLPSGQFVGRFIAGRAEFALPERFQHHRDAVLALKQATWLYAYKAGWTTYQGRAGYPGEYYADGWYTSCHQDEVAS